MTKHKDVKLQKLCTGAITTTGNIHLFLDMSRNNGKIEYNNLVKELIPFARKMGRNLLITGFADSVNMNETLCIPFDIKTNTFGYSLWEQFDITTNGAHSDFDVVWQNIIPDEFVIIATDFEFKPNGTVTPSDNVYYINANNSVLEIGQPAVTEFVREMIVSGHPTITEYLMFDFRPKRF